MKRLLRRQGSGVRLLSVIFVSLLVSCGGGGGGGSDNVVLPPPVNDPDPPNPLAVSEFEASRFLSQATFGPDEASIDVVSTQGLEAWFLTELEKPATLHLNDVLAKFPANGRSLDSDGSLLPELQSVASDSFWENAIDGDDQLRQRMAYALSEIMVVSKESQLFSFPQTLAMYMDVLTQGALGNYRDLLQNVTYTPAMAIFLTYMRNEKADPEAGRVPDENYARELMQLFTIGLVELNTDGSPVLGPDSQPVELFDNTDITGLAKVFTGLSFSGATFDHPVRDLPVESYYQPISVYDEFHSAEPKTFLGTTIPANTNGEESINIALDTLFEHPNVGPFVGRQLIQRFVTSSPEPEYVARVAAAFDAGNFVLPSGTIVGNGVRGDLTATIAAILFDAAARQDPDLVDTDFGKLREPVLRFTHWARSFEVSNIVAGNELLLRNTGSSTLLGQNPYGAPSVFNFYRPGYIAPGTETGAAGLTAPELQISNASTVVGYPNFLTAFALGRSPKIRTTSSPTFEAIYQKETSLGDDVDTLLDRLDLLLTYGTLAEENRLRIADVLEEVDGSSAAGLLERAQIASILVMTTPEYIVLR